MAKAVCDAFMDKAYNQNKWKIAVCMSVPVVIGVWLYRRKKVKKNSLSPDINIKTTKELFVNAYELKEKGNMFFKDGKYIEAVDCYTQAINLCPSEKKEELSTFYQNRAAAYEHLTGYQEVISDCSSAIELNSKYVKALFRRAKAYEHSRDFRHSLDDITAACILDGFENPLMTQLSDRVMLEYGHVRAKEAYKDKKALVPSEYTVLNYLSNFIHDPFFEVVNFGHTLCVRDFHKGQGDSCAQPDTINGDVTLNVHSGYFSRKNTAGDTDVVCKENGSAVIDNAYDSALIRAVAAVKSVEYGSVISLCTDEINMEGSPSKAEALLLRGTFHILCGLFIEASADLEKLLRLEGLDSSVKVNALIKCGNLLAQKDKCDIVMEYFTKAEQLEPDNSDIYYHRGHFMLLMEQNENAITEFKKCISLSPDFCSGHIQMRFAEHRHTLSLQNFQRVDETVKLMKELTDKFPQFSEAYIFYAHALLDLHQYDLTIQVYNQAFELARDNADIVVFKGLVFIQQQEMEKAADVVTSALDVDPTCKFAYEVLAMISARRGNMESAVEFFEKAISLSKTEGDMAHLFSLLEATNMQLSMGNKGQ